MSDEIDYKKAHGLLAKQMQGLEKRWCNRVQSLAQRKRYEKNQYLKAALSGKELAVIECIQGLRQKLYGKM